MGLGAGWPDGARGTNPILSSNKRFFRDANDYCRRFQVGYQHVSGWVYWWPVVSGIGIGFS